MQKPQKRLGRGLNSLISVSPSPVEPIANDAKEPESKVNVAQIRTNPHQPRKEIAPEALQALAESIKRNGVIQPVVVRKKSDQLYEIIAGERRWRAAQMAGLSEIPVVIRDATEEEMLEIALVENILREDLNAIERAMAYRNYCNEFDLSPEQVAQKLSEDRTTVVNYLRLLELPSEVKEWLTAGAISMGHARCLLALRSPAEIVRTAKQAIDEGMSVRGLEQLVRDKAQARATASTAQNNKDKTKRPQIAALEQAFVRTLGTKVDIHESRRKGSGKIVIHYYTLDDFDRIADSLGVTSE
ncbi:MAG: ParB/RepB/Spo0J family partition protein [Phycisphaerales bacterium]|nr:ParB/RepB/Spo0J family partition protein [Phycisphaerales bacterium]